MVFHTIKVQNIETILSWTSSMWMFSRGWAKLLFGNKKSSISWSPRQKSRGSLLWSVFKLRFHWREKKPFFEVNLLYQLKAKSQQVHFCDQYSSSVFIEEKRSPFLEVNLLYQGKSQQVHFCDQYSSSIFIEEKKSPSSEWNLCHIKSQKVDFSDPFWGLIFSWRGDILRDKPPSLQLEWMS